VIVVRHQAEGVGIQPEPVHRPPELNEELPAVVAVEVDLSSLDPARRRVPDAVLREGRSRQTRHLRQR
jgi:hypothetical protein